MKSRVLRKLLNDTEYTIGNNREYIAVGGPYVHNLISVDKKTLKIKYALDTFHEGRKAIKNKELEFIWDKLHELVENGQIKDIIEGKDEIENPLPVFTVEDGKLIETFTDKYGWPNTTIDGDIMYENTYFKTKDKAIKYGIEETEIVIKWKQERLVELNKEKEKVKEEMEKYEFRLDHLKSLK